MAPPSVGGYGPVDHRGHKAPTLSANANLEGWGLKRVLALPNAHAKIAATNAFFQTMNSLFLRISARSFTAGLGIWALSLTPAQATVGGFTGPLSLFGGDHPAGAVVTQPGISTFGQWSGLIQGSATIDTTMAPGSVSLSAAGALNQVSPGSGFSPLNAPTMASVAQLEILSAVADGSLSFDYSLSIGSQLEVFHGIHGTPSFVLQTLTSGSSVVIPFSVGEAFGFRVVSDTLALPGPLTVGRGVAGLAAPGFQGVIVSNPVLTVPETSTIMGSVVVLGLAGATLARKVRR